MIGEWVDADENSVIETSCRWTTTAILSISMVGNDAWSRGGRGGAGRSGGGARGGGGASRAQPGGASRTPSMSRSTSHSSTGNRASANRPSTGRQPTRPNTGNRAGGAENRPNPSGSRPNAGGGSRPSPGAGRPNTGSNRPAAGNNRPNTGGNRPNVGENRPNTGSNRPNIGGGSQVTGRPGSSGRPSRSDMDSFLDLPGASNQRPNSRPDLASRGDRSDVNINTGNNVIVNRQNNIQSIRNRWTNVDNRPFDNNWWANQHFSGNYRHWHGSWNNYPNNWCWRPSTWAACGTWFAWNLAKPFNYDLPASPE